MLELNLVQKIAIWILPLLFAITVHEAAHGLMAYKLGDKTALFMGRLTLNPLKHIDMIGTLIIPAILLLIKSPIIFGWAKPVPINPRHLSNPRRDMALIGASGPVSNFLMAILWALFMKLGILLLHSGFGFALPIVYIGQAGVFINLALMVFNLIPIPPLDGSKILAILLPRRMAFKYEMLSPYFFLILILLILTGIMSFIFWHPVMFLYNVFSSIFGLGF